MRLAPILTVVLALVVLPGDTILAQSVRGTVVEQGTERPLWGAFVVLLDENGGRRGAALTDTAGHFFLRAPAVGRYALRVERIGHRSTTSPVLELAAGQTLVYRLEAPVAPISLDGIRVSGESRCRLPRELGPATQLLWDEARKALAVVAWIEGDRGVPYQTFLYERTRNPLTLEIEEQRARLRSGYGRMPFQSVSARDLATHGYVRRLGGGVYHYFGVDAQTLLSGAFLETHCFRIREPEDDVSPVIGLGFEPAPGRSLPDITGVLWLDRETSELRSLEFEFTEHLYPIPLPSRPFGGWVEFRRLANGAWIVERWWLRMPQFPAGVQSGTLAMGALATGARPTDDERDLLIAAQRRGLRVREEGGEVRFIVEPGPVAHGNAAVEGVVYDSTRARPLAGATVFLTTARRSTTTDADGRFRMKSLPSGAHEVAFIHPYADSLGLAVRPRPIELTGGEFTRAELFIPRGSGCSAPGGVESGTVAGVVYAGSDGRPLTGVQIVAEWRSRNSTGRGFRGGTRRREVRTGDTGRFLLCNLPIGYEVRLTAIGDGFEEDVDIRIDGPGLIRRDVLVR